MQKKKLLSLCLASIICASAALLPATAAQDISSAQSVCDVSLNASALPKPEPLKQPFSIYLYDVENQVACNGVDLFLDAQYQWDFSLLDQLEACEGTDLGKRLPHVSMLEIFQEDDSKYRYEFYELGIKVTQYSPGPGAGTESQSQAVEKSYLVDSDGYKAFQKTLNEAMEQAPLVPSWLALMRGTNAQSIRFIASDEQQEYSYEADPNSNFLLIFDSLKEFLVVPGSAEKMDKGFKLRDAAHVQIEFFNGITYNVWCGDKNLLIYSSDLDYGLKYQLEPSQEGVYLEELNRMAQGERYNPPTAKPVIYLYPEEEQTVSVKLSFQGTLATTIPAYQNGWQVLARPDGTLTNLSDGQQYPYLFWDGSTKVPWDISEGFVVKAEETESFLREKLSFLGLNESELSEFLSYWLPELRQSPYCLISFAGEEYDHIAPLEISPKPDHLLRVHMVWQPLSAPIQLPPQQLTPFEREGFTVVEWGGTKVRA